MARPLVNDVLAIILKRICLMGEVVSYSGNLVGVIALVQVERGEVLSDIVELSRTVAFLAPLLICKKININ